MTRTQPKYVGYPQFAVYNNMGVKNVGVYITSIIDLAHAVLKISYTYIVRVSTMKSKINM